MARRIITLEEHFLDPAVTAAGREQFVAHSPGFGASYDAAKGLPYAPTPAQLTDLGDGRIADMDAHGISMQVISALNPQYVPADDAAVVRSANDRAAAAVTAYPDRFAAFAGLPTAAPEVAADELSRCVSELGFVGAMIFGRTDDEFLSAPRFAPVLERVAQLGVPIYLHPAAPPVETSRTNYDGFDDVVTARFQTAAWGWHNETAVHFIHLYLAGVFDRYPDLQVILGHWGELIPFYLERIDEAIPVRASGLDRGFADVFRQNVYVTPSGMWTQANFRYCVEMLGVERIMFSVDYPFLPHDGAVAFLEDAQLGDAEKDLVGHGTAERVLGLGGAR
jgi:hypothetical protein